MSIDIREVSLETLCGDENFHSLLEEYSEELKIEGLPKPKADLETYKIIEKLGSMKLFTAWDGDIIVGLINIITSSNPHYGVVIPSSESFYVSKNSRKTGAGIKLLMEAEKYVKSIGAGAFFVGCHVGSNLRIVLQKRGYEEEVITSVKRMI